ncbi:unnamed protein product [Durusdinium trenchii]|uniref:Uncharacterized protein n=1 Tax=Durusdinium trenchii TaxID=1381693 RepID=A0ABP0PBL1_9DINO
MASKIAFSPPSMSIRTERIDAWFGLAGSCMSDSGWEVAARTKNKAALSHRSSPWGGHLLKFEFFNLFIENAPPNPSDLLVRPEVRGTFDDSWPSIRVKWEETYAPGDALVQRSSTLWIFRLASVLFGHSSGPSENSFFYDPKPIPARHQLRRDFPEPKDCSYAAFQDYHGVGQEGILIARNLGQQNRFRVVLVFSTPEDKWPYWAAPFFHWLTDTLHKAALRFLNRPLVQQMRAIDANLYMVLGMRSFNRGPPLLPEKEDSSESISISNKSGDVTHWTRLKRKFRMTEYLHSFMAALGYDLKTYQSLEGRTLVNYQCVVLRKDWETHRAAFVEAFSLQKAAYRRANGGTTAPSLVEDARANFISEGSNASDSPSPMIVKTVVRKTFLELEEEELEKFSEIPLRRSKSDSFGDGWTSILSEGLQK